MALRRTALAALIALALPAFSLRAQATQEPTAQPKAQAPQPMTGESGPRAESRRPAANRNAISRDEIDAAPAMPAFAIIQRLRPHWLRTRGQSSLSTQQTTTLGTAEVTTTMAARSIVIYIDNQREGTESVLRSISSLDIDSMEFLDAMAATQRFGTGHAYGAILIRRRSRN